MGQPIPTGPKRRDVLRAVAAGAAAGIALPSLASAEIAPPAVSSYPAKAFRQTEKDPALQAMFGTATLTDTADVRMEAPDIAENGAVVPVTFDANLPGITAAGVLALDNPFILACAYKIPPGTSPAISSRIKLAKTTQVISVIQSNGKLMSTAKQVKVTLGGCG
ncbi:thiosulfate oxidation carrier protein SoxY [Acidiphilium sp. PA]|uniref:thiosulfate oxidation carrier protein SoxY n=1 Tax=Acidiphilium sp. PA TaxID=2871705 RepID=UPI0022444D5D|nr:thiosulfate oxidation carrier protein SoxY [Acidiphilium sp. PA]MCW8307208.1 thiosulfate oxidation carrier protein SoxY [Acidiphilium sp. PA]